MVTTIRSFSVIVVVGFRVHGERIVRRLQNWLDDVTAVQMREDEFLN